MTGPPPNWQLILEAATALTAARQTPFTRASVYEWIWRRHPRDQHDRPSLDPVFQGMTGNAPGGVPAPCGTPLHRTGHGRYILNAPQPGDRGHTATSEARTADRDPAADAGRLSPACNTVPSSRSLAGPTTRYRGGPPACTRSGAATSSSTSA